MTGQPRVPALPLTQTPARIHPDTLEIRPPQFGPLRFVRLTRRVPELPKFEELSSTNGGSFLLFLVDQVPRIYALKIASLCIVSFAFLTGFARADELLTVEQILARHQATLDRLHRCQMTSFERCTTTRADGAVQTMESTRSTNLRLDGNRVNMLVRETNLDVNVANQHSNEFCYLRDGHVLRIYFPHEKFNVRPPSASAVNGRLAAEADDEHFVESVLGGAAIAFGVTNFPNIIPLANLLRSGTDTRVTRDDIGYCIEGASKDGARPRVWFDPDASFVVTRLLLEQSGATLNDNRFQYNRRVLKSLYGFSDKSVVNSVTFEVRKTKVVPWKDSHVITALETVKTISTTDGAKALENTSYTFTDWNLEPDFSDPSSFRPMIPIPEKVRVSVEDTPSLEYEYVNGQIQLAVNTDTLEKLKDIPVVPRRPAQSQMQWIWGVVTTILGMVWWRIRTNSG